MRKAFFCFVPAFAAAILFACDDTPSAGPGTGFTFDAGDFDAPIPVMPDGAVADAPADAPLQDVKVQIVSNTGGLADIRVIWHDATGAVTGTAKTDMTGLATSPVPAPAMVTVLFGSGGPGGGERALTWTGVQAGDKLFANATDYNGSIQTGTYNVTMDQTPQVGATGYHIRAGNCDIGGFSPTLNQAYEIPLVGDCGASPGAVLAISHDDASAVNGFSFKKGLTPLADGGFLDVTTGPWSAPTTTTLTVANMPETGIRPIPFLTEIAGALAFAWDPAVSSQPQLDANGQSTFQVAAGFADAYQYGFLARDIRMGSAGKRLVGKRGATSAALSLDYNTVLPQILTAGIDQTADAARPTFTWTTSASLATTDGGTVSIRWQRPGDDLPSAWTIIVPPDATTVKLPALPSDASAWLPPAPDAGLFQPLYPTVLFAESDVLQGYADVRKYAGIVFPPVTRGATLDQLTEVSLPVNGTLRITEIESAPN